MEEFKRILIQGYPCIVGDASNVLKKEPFKELNVDDSLTQIGKKHSGLYNKLHFANPATYRGVFEFNEERFLAIEMDLRDLSGNDLFNNPTNVYILIAISDDETLFLQNFNDNVSKIVHPVFKLA